MTRNDESETGEPGVAPVRSAGNEKRAAKHPGREAGGGELANRIVEARGRTVILDADLAAIYGVETRALNQAVKRNADRFPGDFAFRLSLEELRELQSLRSQTVILGQGRHAKYGPWAFTEHGAIMAASVLNSPRAVEMSVFVVRAFVRLRDLAGTHAEIARQLELLERRVTTHDRSLERLFAALRQLLEPASRTARTIGFQRGEAPGGR